MGSFAVNVVCPFAVLSLRLAVYRGLANPFTRMVVLVYGALLLFSPCVFSLVGTNSSVTADLLQSSQPLTTAVSSPTQAR